MSYTKPTISNYNDNPPTNDGSENFADNGVDWDLHIDEIGDPLKNYIDSVNNATDTAFDSVKSITAANKAAAVLLTPEAGTTLYVLDNGGGLFKAVTGASASTYADDGGTNCGTQFIPTGGDGSTGWVREYDGPENILWYSGGDLAAMWDTYRANLTQGNRYSIIIPVPPPNHTAATEISTDVWRWSLDTPMQFDDPENLGNIYVQGEIIATTAMTEMMLFGPTNKTEDLYFPLGIPFLDCDGTADVGIRIQGCARIIIDNIVKVNDCDTALFVDDTVGTASQIFINELYCGRWENEIVLLNGTSVSAVSDVRIGRVWAEDAQQVTSNGMLIKGNVTRLNIGEITSTISPTNTMANGVLMQANAAGRPNLHLNFGIVDVVATTAFKTEDQSSGAADKIQGLDIDYIMVRTGTVAANIEWANDPVIHNWFPDGTTITIGSNTIRERFDVSGSFTGTMTGLTTSPTGTVDYTRSGRRVTLDVPSISGTSNTTAMTITGAPSNIFPANPTEYIPCRITNNASTDFGIVRLDSAATLEFKSDAAGAAFTNSGAKGVLAFSITYDLD